jgi:hypothetical protein
METIHSNEYLSMDILHTLRKILRWNQVRLHHNVAGSIISVDDLHIIHRQP